MSQFLLDHKFIHCFPSSVMAANEDIFNGSPDGDVISLEGWAGISFLIVKNAGTAGTATITVKSCDDVTPTTGTAIAFWYRVCTTIDTWGAWTAATTSGFTTTAGADQMYEIAVLADGLSGSDKYVQLNTTETVDGACDGAIIGMLFGPRYAQSIPPTDLV